MALVLALACLFVYVRTRADLDASVDAALRSRADLAVALVERSGEGALRGTALAEPEESFAQVLSATGAVQAATAGNDAPALTPAEAGRVARGLALKAERGVAGVEGQARVLARPAAANGSRVAVAVGSSLDDRDETLAGLLRSFAVGAPLAVLLASGLGFLLARTGLAPVEAMRRRAEQVSLEEPGERLPLPAARDEVGRLGRTLNDMLARLEASFERERQFVADAGHELRTPLAVLKTEIETALRSATAEGDRRDALVAALTEVDHLAQMADDLLTLARPTADGGLPLRRQRVRVLDGLEAARDRFVERARAEGREITVEAPDDLWVEADPLRLRQALGNLVDNALRHGDGRVRLEARRSGGEVEIEVADDGPGFPPAMAAQAFERFTRGEGARARGGSGLGLAIVQAIAQAHGGGAALDASGRAGAVVRVRLPALTSISSERPTLATEQQKGSA